MAIKKTSTKKGIGYSPLTQRIYLGRQNKAKGMWIGEKEDITSEFIGVVFEWIGSNEVRTITGLTSLNENLIINVKLDKKSIELVIKNLQKRLETDFPDK